jgi:hypothetical protein
VHKKKLLHRSMADLRRGQLEKSRRPSLGNGIRADKMAASNSWSVTSASIVLATILPIASGANSALFYSSFKAGKISFKLPH